MKYWDASGVVPLLVRQERTPDMQLLLEQDPVIITWWGTYLECYSALMRLLREGHLDTDDVRNAARRLGKLRDGWNEIQPGEGCRRTAERMLRVHPLRAADALQLAAAMIAADHNPGRMDLVCLDQRLITAGRKEGFVLAGEMRDA